MNGWLVQLKPFSPDERSGGALREFQENCIKSGITGMGWHDTGILSGLKGTLPIHDYKTAFRDGYRSHNPQQSASILSGALNCYDEMREGDLVVTRLFGSNECYAGRISSPVVYNNGVIPLHFDFADNFSWVASVDWRPIGNFSNIPNCIRGVMQGRMPTVKRLRDAPALHMLELLCKPDGKSPKYRLTEEDFCTALDAFDLEDLVGFYMLSLPENEGYQFLPSSCKLSEPLIEFKCVCNEKAITCQVKNKRAVDAGAFESISGLFERIYLFSGIGQYQNEENKPANAVIIERNRLFAFLKEQFKAQGYFYWLLHSYYCV